MYNTPGLSLSLFMSLLLIFYFVWNSTLFSQMESYLKVLQDQLRGISTDDAAGYPPSLEVYVPAAISEYKRYLSSYFKVGYYYPFFYLIGIGCR